jgi:diacylglycerol kinase (ATP)
MMTLVDHSQIVFIINPNSGARRYKHIIRKIKGVDPNLRYVVTRHNETVGQLFDEIIEKYSVFVMVGGDGTVHDAARYLINREGKSLAVIPNGSGNGFAYEMGFRRNVRSLLEDIRKGQTCTIDVINLNGLECINIAGLGFDSYVAHRFSRGKTRGFLTYLVITIRSLFTFRPVEATLSFEGKTIAGKYQMICIANNKQFGNYAFIAPFARPDDGIIDVVLIKRFPFYLYPDFVVRLFRRRLKDSKYITYLKTDQEISITANMGEYHIDGEPVEFQGPVTISAGRNYLDVVRVRGNRL